MTAHAFILRRLIAERRQRERYFDAALFGEPAWDILLDLALATAEDRKVYVTSCCIASGAPWTTGLRYIALLTDAGLVERQPDPGDGRRCYLSLTETGRDAMDAYLAQTASPSARVA